MAELQIFKVDKKAHVLFPALPARRTPIHHIADDRDYGRYADHPDNDPDN
jgi:hypothetical protein